MTQHFGLASAWLLLASIPMGSVAARAGEGDDAAAPPPAEVLDLLERVRAARGRDGSKMAPLFDVGEMCRRVNSFLPAAPPDSAGIAIRFAVRMLVATRETFDAVETQRLLHFETSGRTAWATVRTRDADGGYATERWLLADTAAGWRVVDQELVDMGMSLAQFVGMGMATLFEKGGGAREYLLRFSRGWSLAESEAHEDAEKAERLLSTAPGIEEPATLLALRKLGLAVARETLGRCDEALKDLLEIQQAAPDLPYPYLMAGWLHLDGDRPEEALAAAEQYLARMGEEPEGVLLRCRALFALGRRLDCVAQIGRILEEEPDHVDLVEALLDDMEEEEEVPPPLVRALSRLPDLVGQVTDMVPLTEVEWYPPSVHAALAAALRARKAPEGLASCYAAAARLNAEDAEGAVETLVAALDQPLGELPRSAVLDLLLAAAESGAKVLEKASPRDRPYLFTGLAVACVRSSRGEGLDALVRQARAADVKALDLPYFEAELHFLAKRHAEALKGIEAVHAPEAAPPGSHEMLMDVLTSWPIETKTRILVRLGRADEAVAPALRYAELADDHIALLVAHAARKDVAAASDAFRACIEDGWTVASLLEDDDAGPLLNGDAYAALREEHADR